MAETMEVKVDGLEDVLSGLDKRKEYVAKAVNSTCKDFKSRAPGWINKAVTQEYTIKAGDVKGALTSKRTIGTVSLGGVTLDDIYLEYSGRILTFSHFKFTPKKPDVKLLKKRMLIPGAKTSSDSPVVWAYAHKNQNVKVEVKKGHKKTLKGKWMSTPFVASMKGSPAMPFQRSAQKRQDVKALRTISIPQMITNDKVAADINKRIDTELGKRLQHHLDRYSDQ